MLLSMDEVEMQTLARKTINKAVENKQVAIYKSKSNKTSYETRTGPQRVGA